MDREIQINRRKALRNLGLSIGGIAGIAAANRFLPSEAGAVKGSATEIGQKVAQAANWLERTMYDEDLRVQEIGYLSGPVDVFWENNEGNPISLFTFPLQESEFVQTFEPYTTSTGEEVDLEHPTQPVTIWYPQVVRGEGTHDATTPNELWFKLANFPLTDANSQLPLVQDLYLPTIMPGQVLPETALDDFLTPKGEVRHQSELGRIVIKGTDQPYTP